MPQMKLRALLMLAAVTGLAANSAFAQPPSGGPPAQSTVPQPAGPSTGHGDARAAMEAAKTACQGDMQTLCAGKTGRDAMMCMHENRDKLSAGCKDAVERMHRRQGFGGWRRRMRHRWEERRAAADAVRKACQPDIQTLCAGKTGHDAMMCMRDNRDKVSQGCKDAIAKARRHRQWFHRGLVQPRPIRVRTGGTGFRPAFAPSRRRPGKRPGRPASRI